MLGFVRIERFRNIDIQRKYSIIYSYIHCVMYDFKFHKQSLGKMFIQVMLRHCAWPR